MRYLIGIITKPHGIKGGVIIKPLTDFNRYQKDSDVFFYPHNDNNLKPLKLTIKTVKETPKGLIIFFYDYDSIEQALILKGLKLYVFEKPHLADDEYHYNDLLEKAVYNQNGKHLGKIIEVLVVPQGHLIRVELEEGSKLIPFNKVFVKEISEIVVINEIEGLL